MTDPMTPLSVDLLDRYLTNDCTAQEAAAVQAWLVAHPERARAVHALERIGFERPAGMDATWDAAPDLDAAWARFTQGIPQDARVESVQRTARQAPSRGVSRSPSLPVLRAISGWRPLVAAVAATIAIVIGLTVHASRESSGHGRTYATGIGQRATVTLADGSRVRLAPQSTIHVTSTFGRTDRVVSLTGEAYFEVRRTTGTPFLVRTALATTRVLGTTFDVQHYASDAAVRVTVTTGKVMVGGDTPRRPSVTLTAGMTGVVDDSSAITLAAGESASVGWIDGQLVFHKAPTGDVLAALTRWYGYQFRLADSSLAHRNLTLGLSTESSAAALATLKLMLDVDLTFDHNIVTLHPRRGTHAVPRTQELRSRDAPVDPHESSSTTQTEVGR